MIIPINDHWDCLKRLFLGFNSSLQSFPHETPAGTAGPAGDPLTQRKDMLKDREGVKPVLAHRRIDTHTYIYI